MGNFQAAKVGDLIRYGNNNWKVLEVQHNKILILSNYVIEKRKYGKSFFGHMTWKKSDIRKYLNGDFLHKFSSQETDMILRSSFPNPDNKWYGTSGGDSTDDKVFLLSIDEVVKYFGDSGQLNNRRMHEQTIYDIYDSARVARELNGEAIAWWLRSPGVYQFHAALVYANGEISMSGRDVSLSEAGVRPALWLNLTP